MTLLSRFRRWRQRRVWLIPYARLNQFRKTPDFRGKLQ